MDLDIVYDTSPENLENLLGALEEMGAHYRDPAGRRLPGSRKVKRLPWPVMRDTLRFRMIVIAVCVHLGIWFVAALASSVTAVKVILDAQDDRSHRKERGRSRP